MALEINVKNLFLDFNPSKFLVYGCLLVFSLLFALRLDGTISWTYWVIFLPIWIWKVLVITGSVVGSWVWWRHPQYRMEGDAYIQYKAMVICTGMHLLLLMFELLACDKLENGRSQVLWILVFIPLIFMSIVSIGISVWAVKHERTFELELFCSVNILQFIFLALRLDGLIKWSWVIVFIPIWIVMCVALIGVLYAIILAIILLKSPDIIPEQRRGNIFSAVGYTCLVVPLLVFEVLLVNKQDGKDYQYVAVCLPLFVSLITLMLMSFGAKGGNQWWFGLRRDFCLWLLGACPLLQEYGNISYKMQTNREREPEDQNMGDRGQGQGQQAPGVTGGSGKRPMKPQAKKGGPLDDGGKPQVHVVSIELPD